MLEQHFVIHAYKSPDKALCYGFSTRNNCCEFCAFYGTVFQSDIQSYFKTPVCGAPLSDIRFIILFLHFVENRVFIIDKWLRKQFPWAEKCKLDLKRVNLLTLNVKLVR